MENLFPGHGRILLSRKKMFIRNILIPAEPHQTGLTLLRVGGNCWFSTVLSGYVGAQDGTTHAFTNS